MAVLTDREMMALLPQPLLERARLWWADLPSSLKGNCSIWVLLALFADCVAREKEMEKLQ